MTLNIANVLEAKGLCDLIEPNICNPRHVLPLIGGSLHLLMGVFYMQDCIFVFIFQHFFVLQHFEKDTVESPGLFLTMVMEL